MKKQNGISLIVLIVTIILMITIAGAIIVALIGDNGIITKAEDAAFRTDITMIKEKVSLKLMNAMMNNTPIEEFTKVTLEESKTWGPQLKKEIIYWGQYDIGVTEITREYANNQWEYILSQEGILDNLYFVDGEEEGDKKFLYDINADIVYKVASTRVGIYKIHSIEELNVARGIEEVRTIKDISKSVTVDNISHYEPDLSGFALEKTSIVYYDENLETSIEISAEEYLQNKKQRTIVKQIDTEAVTYTFFNYNEQIWANILVEDSGMKSYWVWIPRYSYKISGNETLIEFIGLDNKPLNGNELPSDYIVHSAFGDNLKGIWASKYEPIQTPNQKVANFPYYIPDMTGFNPDNTYIEVYNSEEESFEETKLKDIKDLTKFAKENNWFDYNNQVWANIKVVNPETKVESWWVWIPRYAYNITGNETSIKFIDINNNPLDGSTLPSNYIVHSAFGDDLKGIWASKYEPIQK